MEEMELKELKKFDDVEVKKLSLEAKNEIEFCECNDELPSIVLRFVCIPFNVLNLQENNRDKILKGYKAFIACGNEIEEGSGVGQTIVNLAQKDGPLVGVEFLRFYLKFMGKYQFSIQNWCASPDAKYATLVSSYFKNAQLILVDGYCDKKLKDEVANFICSQGDEEEQRAFAERVVLIERYDSNGNVVDKDGTEALAKLLPPENVIGGDDCTALSKKARELYVKVFKSVLQENTVKVKLSGEGENIIITKNDLEKLLNKANDNQVDLPFEGGKHIKIKKNKFRKLFDKVNDHKGKTAVGIFSLLLEELWRNGFFGGNETNEKTKNVKDLKKLIDLKNADEFPNRKDGNSAPN